MPDIFLYGGEPAPNDVRLTDPTVLSGAGSTLTIVVPVATASATAPALVLEVGALVPLGATSSSAPAPTLVTDMTLTIPTATATATAPAPTITTGDPPAAAGGGTTGLPYGWQLVGREQPIEIKPELEPEPQIVRFTIPAAAAYAQAYAPTLTIDETDLIADIERYLAESDDLAALAYLSPV